VRNRHRVPRPSRPAAGWATRAVVLVLSTAGVACRPDARPAHAGPASALSTDAARRMAGAVAVALLAPFPDAVGVAPDGQLLLVRSLDPAKSGLRVVRRADGRTLYDELTAERQSAPTWRGDAGALAYLVDPDGKQEQRIALVELASRSRRFLPTGPTAGAALQWAPVGSHLAYADAKVGQRTVDVRVVDTAHPDSATALWVAGTDRRATFAWAPDGAQLAAVVAGTRPEIAISRGAGRERRIPVAPYSDVRDLAWSPDGRTILFTGRAPSDDYLALAELDVTGGTIRRVASAGGEIRSPRYLRDRRHLAYHVSADGETQLFVAERAGRRGATARRLLDGPGSATILGETPRGDTLFVSHVGRATMPVLYAVDVATGRRVEVPVGRAAHTDSAPPVEGSRVSIPTRDSLALPAYLWLGQRGPEDSARTLLWVHGGPAIQKVRTWDPVVRLAVHSGFDVILLNYRGSTGYGAAFENAPGGDSARVHDVLAARDFAVRRLGVPPERVILFGHSYGALLAARAAACDPQGFGGVVLVSIVRGRGGAPCAEARDRRAPRRVLAFHGANDAFQPPSAAERQIERLLGEDALQSVAGGLRVFEHEGHNFSRVESWAEVYGAALTLVSPRGR